MTEDDVILSWPGGTPPPDARPAKPADQPVEILTRQPRTGRTDILCTVPVGWSRTITVSVPDPHHIEALLGDSTQELVWLRTQVANVRALCAGSQAEGAGGKPTDTDALWPSQVIEALSRTTLPEE